MSENEPHYTAREIALAERARNLQAILGYPSPQKFEHFIQPNTLHNCDVNLANIRRAYHIYGLSVPTLKGKTKRKKPSAVPCQP